MRWWIALLVAGCVGAVAGPRGVAPPRPAYALDAVEVTRVRAGELDAAREWERIGAGTPVLRREDDEAVRVAFVRSLERTLPLAPDAPARLRVTVTLQDTAYFEGLASEAADLSLTADVYDENGARMRSLVFREPAAAPLQRTASRRQRVDAALSRLAARLAQALSRQP